MGIALCYIRVSPANAALLLDHPKLLDIFLGFEEEASPEKRGFLSRLFGGKSVQKSEPLPPLDPRDEDDAGDADKAWQGMHYIFTGTAEVGSFPEGFIMHGGTPVGDDVEDGPARLFQPGEVQRIDTVLQAQSMDSVRQRYDGKKMDAEGVYPQIWKRDREEGIAYIWEGICEMRDFFHETAKKDYALLIYFN